MITLTAGINNRISEDDKFSAHVYMSMLSFSSADWGDICEESAVTNSIALESLNNGLGGTVLAVYGKGENKIWIIMNEERSTVMFPSEY